MTSIFVFLLVTTLLVFFVLRKSNNKFFVERSIVLESSPESVFGLLSDLKLLNSWNPLHSEKINAIESYTDTPIAQNGLYSWTSKKIGSGNIEIMSMKPCSQVNLKLSLTSPFKATSEVFFELETSEDKKKTRVICSVSAQKNFFSNMAIVIFRLEKWVAKSLESGLNNLKKDLARLKQQESKSY